MVLAGKRDFPDLAPNDRERSHDRRPEFFTALTKEHFRPGSDDGGGWFGASYCDDPGCGIMPVAHS